jgi:hypothetical protein
MVGNVGTPLYDLVWWDICVCGGGGGRHEPMGTFIIVLRIKYESYVNDAETVGLDE